MKESIFYYTKKGYLHELARLETNFESSHEFGIQNHYLRLINGSRPLLKARPTDFGSRFFMLPRKKEIIIQENYDRILSLGFLVLFKDDQLFLKKNFKDEIVLNENTDWLTLFKEQFKLDQTKSNPSVIEELVKEIKETKSDEPEEVYTKYGEVIPVEKSPDFSGISLPNTTQETLESFLGQYEIKDFLKTLGINKNLSVLNFWGPPGTGKTLCAQILSKKLNKPLLKVKYEEVESKFIGETEKNIKKMFSEATKIDAILFLDEADSLLNKRLDSPSNSTENYLNLARNVFMQQLDQFTGIVILTTNLYKSYDPAITSRISKNIKFDLPDQSSRLKILKLNLKQSIKIDNKVKTLNEVAKITNGFSGRDLKNLVEETITKAATESFKLKKMNSFKLSLENFKNEVEKIQTAKDDQKMINPVNIRL